MELSAAGLALIKLFEGFRSTVYLDAHGFPTIGYGHKLLAGESFPDGVTEAQATTLLEGDVGDAEQAVSRLVHVTLSQGQFDALVDFCFNLGQGRLAESTLLADLNEGQYDAAGQQILLWDHVGAQVNAGLKARRQAEFQLWNQETTA